MPSSSPAFQRAIGSRICSLSRSPTPGALDGASNLIVKLVLFLIAVPIAWHEFHFQNSFHAGSHAKVLWLILAIVVVIGLVIAVVLAVPKWRHQVSGKLRKGWGEIKSELQRAIRSARNSHSSSAGSWQPSSS